MSVVVYSSITLDYKLEVWLGTLRQLLNGVHNAIKAAREIRKISDDLNSAIGDDDYCVVAVEDGDIAEDTGECEVEIEKLQSFIEDEFFASEKRLGAVQLTFFKLKTTGFRIIDDRPGLFQFVFTLDGFQVFVEMSAANKIIIQREKYLALE